jgi:CheY-like chemotaxis protein
LLHARLAQAATVPVEMIPAESPVWAKADSAQLAEVLLALAAPQREGTDGRTRLTVTCDFDRIAERLPIASLPSGLYARITLREDGRGLDATKLASIFDPVLHPGRPDGLALANAHSLVRQWGGDIACLSEPNRGMAFSIYLSVPDLHSPGPGAPPVFGQVENVPASEPERETILVVDDEAGIRGLMRKILKRERYVVIEAATAEEALQKAAEHGKPIQLLLTDVMLPGMLGPELARKLYALDPSLKVLYISGYTQDESVRTGEYPPGAKFLAKPFTLGALLSKVRETLDAEPV